MSLNNLNFRNEIIIKTILSQTYRVICAVTHYRTSSPTTQVNISNLSENVNLNVSVICECFLFYLMILFDD